MFINVTSIYKPRCSTTNVNNFTKIVLTSQQNEFKKALFLKLLSQLPYRVLLIIDYLLKLQSKYGVAYPKQFTIGKKSKYSRTTANKWCQRLQRLGFFHMKYTHLEANIYSLHGIFFDPEFRKQIEKYLPAARLMPLMMLMAISLTHISNTSNVTNVTNVKKTIKTKKLLWEFQHPLGEAYWKMSHYGGERPPSKHLSFTWEQISPYRDILMDYARKEKEHHVEFTQQELKALAEGFSKESLDYAMMIVKEDVTHGKQISNLFNYVAGICSRYEQRNPKTGRTGGSVHSKPLPSSVHNHESDFQAALNYEATFHVNFTRDKRAWEFSRAFSNPFMKFLSEEEQQRVMVIHQGCTCRSFPVLGNKQQHALLEIQFPSQAIKAFDEQYTPLVDALYEGYEECLD